MLHINYHVFILKTDESKKPSLHPAPILHLYIGVIYLYICMNCITTSTNKQHKQKNHQKYTQTTNFHFLLFSIFVFFLFLIVGSMCYFLCD